MSTTTIIAAAQVGPRWLIVYGYATAAVLLLAAGLVPWLELLFPAWVAVLSVHLLMALRSGPPESAD